MLLSLGPLNTASPSSPSPCPTPTPSPCSCLGCVSGISLKKLRFNHEILLLDITTNLLQLFVCHSRPSTIQPLPTFPDSSPCFPHPHSPFPECPPPHTFISLCCTWADLSAWNTFPAFSTWEGLQGLLPCCLLQEAVPDCPQVEVETPTSGHPSAIANARI